MCPNLKLLLALFDGVSACHSTYFRLLNSRITPNPYPWLYGLALVFSLILFHFSVFHGADEQGSRSVPQKFSSTSTNATVTLKKNLSFAHNFWWHNCFWKFCYSTQFCCLCVCFGEPSTWRFASSIVLSAPQFCNTVDHFNCRVVQTSLFVGRFGDLQCQTRRWWRCISGSCGKPILRIRRFEITNFWF